MDLISHFGRNQVQYDLEVTDFEANQLKYDTKKIRNIQYRKNHRNPLQINESDIDS